MDPRLDRLFSSLGAEFDAALAREESEAASDLAFSLLQDRTLSDEIRDGGWDVATPVGAVPVEEVGDDYVGGAGWILCSTAQTFRAAAAGAPPQSHNSSFHERLRALARQDRAVQIVLADGVAHGRVTACGRDYLKVSTAGSEQLVPIGLVVGFRLSLEG